MTSPAGADAADPTEDGTWGVRRMVATICLAGITLTAVGTALAVRNDQAGERELLRTQTEQAAAVLSLALLVIEQPLAAALEVQAAVPPAERSDVFARQFGIQVGPDEPFVAASLWDLGAEEPRRVATLGGDAAIDPDGPVMRTYLERALESETAVVERMDVDDRMRIAYALADPGTGLVVYAERPLPADRRAPVDRDSAFAQLNYAIYLGDRADPADLTTTNVDPDELPFTGLTHAATVPFGDNVLTLTATPREHLGSPLSQALPLIVLVSGLLLTGLVAFGVGKIVRARQRAVQDTRTITTLYERVDSLYDEQRALSVRLQRALLPQVIPEVPELEIAAEYVAAAEGIEIGGDWYSVVRYGEEGFAFVVGDVSGHGIDAVAEMARARFTLRAYLLDENDPAAVLEKSSHQFDVSRDGHMVTALVGRGNWRTGEITLANAGHPAPVLAARTGGARLVEIPVGPPLGAGPGRYTSVTFTLEPGSVLACYTDGLVERRGEAPDTGFRRLVAAIGPLAGDPLDSLISSLLVSLREDDARDDIAILALRRRASS